jgi:hypothetical protein
VRMRSQDNKFPDNFVFVNHHQESLLLKRASTPVINLFVHAYVHGPNSMILVLENIASPETESILTRP